MFHLPKMLTAMDLRLLSLSSFMMVCTHSYKIEFPAFFAVSVVVATCYRVAGGGGGHGELQSFRRRHANKL